MVSYQTRTGKIKNHPVSRHYLHGKTTGKPTPPTGPRCWLGSATTLVLRLVRPRLLCESTMTRGCQTTDELLSEVGERLETVAIDLQSENIEVAGRELFHVARLLCDHTGRTE